jgi:hypothetical protein
VKEARRDAESGKEEEGLKFQSSGSEKERTCFMCRLHEEVDTIRERRRDDGTQDMER